MFATAANPYEESIVKATDENLASEDWALNIDVCDKVTGDGQAGARNAVLALQKRLSHRNPNVQLYALELANTLAQNCGKPLLEELSSRGWTTALDRLINDRATAAPVKKKALIYIKAWAKQFEATGDPNLGMMGELYDQLRAKNHVFEEPEAAPESSEDIRRRREEDEFARVLELSKQDKGGRYQPSAPAADEADVPDLNLATRVRALYTFASAELGELNFERGDVIKVLDRGFKEWWRGACNGKIGIFPVTYVEAMPEPSPRELQDEAQEEARVFASLGLVDQLLQTLKGIDPSRGDRIDDRPEIEEMYQASVSLQGQINALIKKYSDQKAELEHMNANFLRAMRQYEELRSAPQPATGGQAQYGYAPPQEAYAQQYPDYPQHAPQTQYPQQSDQQYAQYSQQPQQAFQQQGANASFGQHGDAPGQYYDQQPQSSTGNLHRVPTGAPSYPPSDGNRKGTGPGAAGIGAGADPGEHAAAWEAYHRQQAEQSGQPYQSHQYEQANSGFGGSGSAYPPYGERDQGLPSYDGPPSGAVNGIASGIGRTAVRGE
ncbi:MAG: ESCRT-0 subunit protein hse1 [Tremellales sp. Tagirdzhanova-0007]|nr:MAG: ESCRT-0 subunit protein hse1 [Tremellales sp. Tagirdzhanova-0007]